MNRDVLIISTMDGAENCAALMTSQVNARVEIAHSRRGALAALRKVQYGVVVVEESLAESDPEWTDQVWELAGLAIPLQVNFAISGCGRLGRDVKAALARREGERAIARRAAVAEVENELKSTVTGLLLESELALRNPATPPDLQPNLRHMVELAVSLQERLRSGTDAASDSQRGRRV